MAKNKRNRTNKKLSSYHHFPEVKGKTVELVEVDQDAQAASPHQSHNQCHGKGNRVFL